MAKLYEKLMKSCPSASEVKHELNKISSMKMTGGNKHLMMNILNCIDLTSLHNTDSKSKILHFTGNVNSFHGRFSNIPNVAAICVFPNFVPVVKEKLMVKTVKIASVAGSFPTSQTFKSIKISECKMASDLGADEIDIVIPLGAFIAKDYAYVAEEIREIKNAIGDRTLKVIIESGVLQNIEPIYTASMIAMDAGADFIKTSTGKTAVSATPEAAYVMCRAISNFYAETGIKVGFKAAGGITTPEEALTYYKITGYCLGEHWLNNSLFRIGASRLANNILSEIAGEKHEHF